MSIQDTTYKILAAVTAILMTLAHTSCDTMHEDRFIIHDAPIGSNPGNRQPVSISRDVLLIYSAGYNSLSEDLQANIDTLMGNWLPTAGVKDDIVLVYTHSPKRYGNYSTPTSPYLIRISEGPDGQAVADTLITYPEGSISSSAEQLNQVLNDTRDLFPARYYSMVFLSHATGYLPAGFYGRSDKYIYDGSRMMARGAKSSPVPVPYVEIEQDPSLPKVRSIGQMQSGSAGNYVSYEIDLREFAEAIPFRLEYLHFDACLMGGIEVAYELRGKCAKIGISQAEVLAQGLDYSSLTTHLLKGPEPDMHGICDDYYQMYDSKTDPFSRSATISLIDCDRLDMLADVCRDIFHTHRDGLSGVRWKDTQRYYRSGHHWFYDLESIIANAGATEDEMALLHEALDECVLYKAHTPSFLCEFDINIFSGFSMYLPSHGNMELDKYYKTLQWNMATGLVE